MSAKESDKMKIYLLGVLLIMFLAGCHPREVAMWNMHGSKDDYKACLQANPDNASKCEVQRQLYEVDRDAVEATSRGHIKVK